MCRYQCPRLPAVSLSNCSLHRARRLLGHPNISTTQRYKHFDERELADAQNLVE